MSLVKTKPTLDMASLENLSVEGVSAPILIVDDVAANRLVLHEVLEPLGHEILEADSGEAALRLLLEKDFAVILLDVQMPEMDGFETARLIRTRPSSSQTPILFVTAYHQQEIHVRQGYALGAVDYLFKPFEPGILRTKVSFFVDSYREKTALYRFAQDLITQAEQGKQRTHAELQHSTANKAHEGQPEDAIELEALAYMVCQTVRQPLQKIVNNVELLATLVAGTADKKAARPIRNIMSELHALEQTTQKLLTFSGVKQGLDHYCATSSARVLEEVMEELKPVIRERGVSVQAGRLPWVCSDSEELAYIFTSLIENALHYSQEGATHILVDANVEGGTSDVLAKTPETGLHGGVSSAQSNMVRFSVMDNGRGMDMRHAEEVFQLRKKPSDLVLRAGSGLDLPLISRLIQRQGGRIWCTSALNSGTTVYFTLPESQPEKAQTELMSIG